MDIGSILLILGILILVVLYITQPLVKRQAIIISQDEHHYSALLAERDRILTALQELDFDYQLGKIPESSYPSQRAILLQQGADTLRQIDEYHGESTVDSLDDRVEAAIEDRRQETREAETISDQDEELEEMIANRRRVRNGKSGGFCPQCGNPVQRSDQFCSKCGNTLA